MAERQETTTTTGDSGSPFALTNIRLFLAFRVLFNARFYYPVFTVLFLDYGLTLEQFALLNTVWAVTIVLAEVPSGALADVFGRKRLLVATALLMVVEMALLAFVPLGDGRVIFFVFLANRVLSGLAEALASGADEALAYDTLVAHDLAAQWPRVLDWQMRVQNGGFIVAMTLGAAVYDHRLLNRVLAWFGLEGSVHPELSMRLPIYLTLGFALLALGAVLRLREPQTRPSRSECAPLMVLLGEATRLTLRAGGWILRTPFALAVILFAMMLDHVLRLVVTLTSEYYRLIGLPEASFGLIGSAVAVLGLFVPRLARWLSERFSPGRNLLGLAAFSVVALALLALFLPYLGVLPMMAVFVALTTTSFFTSHYLNAVTESHQRATVLSFKGLAFNAAYGAIGVGFAAFIAQARAGLSGTHPDWSADLVQAGAFRAAFAWLPGYLVLGLLLAALLCLPRLRRRERVVDGS